MTDADDDAGGDDADGLKAVTTPRFEDDAGRAYLWRVTHRPAGEAWAFEVALRAAVGAARRNSEGFALCQDPRVLGRGLRQAMLGGGRRPTHRLIFETDRPAGRIRLLALRGLAQPDLTPADPR